jgi:hypothetical protein
VNNPAAGNNLPPIPTIAPVTVSALLADPAGAGRSVHYEFVTCPILDSDTSRCTADGGLEPLLSGDVLPQDASAVVSVTFTPSFELLLTAFQEDPYHGFGFLPLYVQLTIRAGDEQVVGFKRVLFTAWFDPTTPPPAPNQNPFIPEVTIGGHVWAESEIVPLSNGPYEVAPALDPAWEESYLKPTFEGPTLQFKESWRYNYFASGGTFDKSETGGTETFTGAKGGIPSNWSGPADGLERDITFWVVVRDGRGGENWVQRGAHYAR